MSWHKHKNTQKYKSDLCCINLTLNWEYYVKEHKKFTMLK